MSERATLCSLKANVKGNDHEFPKEERLHRGVKEHERENDEEEEEEEEREKTTSVV